MLGSVLAKILLRLISELILIKGKYWILITRYYVTRVPERINDENLVINHYGNTLSY